MLVLGIRQKSSIISFAFESPGFESHTDILSLFCFNFFMLFLLLLRGNRHCWWKSWSLTTSSVIDHSHTWDKNTSVSLSIAVRDFSVSACLSHPRIKLLSQTVHHCYMSRLMTKPTKLHVHPAIWVLAWRTSILLVLSWVGSYIKLPSSDDFRSQWPPKSRRVPLGSLLIYTCSGTTSTTYVFGLQLHL